MDRQTVSWTVPVSGCRRAYGHREMGWCTACNQGIGIMIHIAKAQLSSCHYALPINAGQGTVGRCLQNSSSVTACLIQVVLFSRVQIFDAQHLWYRFL